MREIELELCNWLLKGRNSRLNKTSVFGVGGAEYEKKLDRFAFLNFAEALKLIEFFDRSNEIDLRLRLAICLSPKDAIAWDSSNTSSRVDVIAEHLESAFSLSQKEAENLARSVASTLRAWETRRRSLSDKTASILEKQGFKCACCHVEITEPRILEEETKSDHDAYKPYFAEPGIRTWLSGEVDHIDPISQSGSNLSANLQVLCKLCNSGKADGTGISTNQELKYCGLEIGQTKMQYRRRLLYNRIAMDDYKCSMCGSSTNELTVRQFRQGGSLVLLNLRSFCYGCLNSTCVPS